MKHDEDTIKKAEELRGKQNASILRDTAEGAMEKIFAMWTYAFNPVEYDRKKALIFARLDRNTSFCASMRHKDHKIVIEIEQQ